MIIILFHHSVSIHTVFCIRNKYKITVAFLLKFDELFQLYLGEILYRNSIININVWLLPNRYFKIPKPSCKI